MFYCEEQHWIGIGNNQVDFSAVGTCQFLAQALLEAFISKTLRFKIFNLKVYRRADVLAYRRLELLPITRNLAVSEAIQNKDILLGRGSGAKAEISGRDPRKNANGYRPQDTHPICTVRGVATTRIYICDKFPFHMQPIWQLTDGEVPCR